MYRVVKDFDGTDTDKCISLQTGDILKSVHAIDSSWFVGYNSRTRETGAFPADHVEEVQKTGKPNKATFENPMYSHMDVEDDRIISINSKQNVNDDKTQGQVRFTDINLEHSLSVNDSVLSWDDSFEQSLDSHHAAYANVNKAQTENETKEKTKPEGVYQTIGNVFPRKIKTTTAALLQSKRNENRLLKASFGVFAGLGAGGILYTLLVLSFGYKPLHAGIIVAVSTLVFCIALSLSTLCRCIMALLLPNFFTGKGRAVVLSAIFGILLAGPITNITFNAKETGYSMACVIDLIGDQVKVLQREMAEPVKQMTEYVETQKQELGVVVNNIEEAISTTKAKLDAIDKSVENALTVLNDIYQKCRRPITSLVEECKRKCSSFPFISGTCLSACSQLNQASTVCDPLKTGQNFVSNSARQTRSQLDSALQYFNVDVTLKGDFSGGTNTSKDSKHIKKEVQSDIDTKSKVLEYFIFVIKKILSLTLFLLFLQSFWYLRNYLAKDGFDNVYITKRFKAKDGEKSVPVLPLKTKERDAYIETSSIKLTRFELKYSRLGIAEVFLHSLVSLSVVLFDFLLYYILNLIRKYASIDFVVQGQAGLVVKVNGKGVVADFYRVLLRGLDIESGFMASLHVNKCLPNPLKPESYFIPVLFIMYLIAIAVCVLRGYGMRLRRKIAAYYYPEQEEARLEYLHKTIRHKRAGFLRFLRQDVQSSSKERKIKSQFRFSTWITSRFTCLARWNSANKDLECTGCEHTAGGFQKVVLTKCPGIRDDKQCEAVYCEECRKTLENVCPLCANNDVSLRI